MAYNQLIKDRLSPLLIVHGYRIAEEIENFIRFRSSKMEIYFGYDNREKSCSISIGEINDYAYSLTDKAVDAIFDFSLPIEQVTPEVFVQNVITLLSSHSGNELIEGNIAELIHFSNMASAKYTDELLLGQALKDADKAWTEKNYAIFVEIIDDIGLSKVSATYQTKYKVAFERK